MRTDRRQFLQTSLGALALGSGLNAALGLDSAKCVIVIGPKPHRLEQKAAFELQRYFLLLFGFAPAILPSVDSSADALVLLGSANANPAVTEAAGAALPTLTEQGFLLRRTSWMKKPALLVVGGSPIATLWAAYDLLENYGVRYLFRGDFIPEKRQSFFFPTLDLVREPSLRFRCWRIWNAHACGPEAWGIQEQRRIIDQLVKQKVNAIVVSLWATQPFVHYEFRGVNKTTGDLFWGWKYPLDCKTIGKDKFAGASEFVNPDFANAKTYEDRLAAGQELMHSILEYAKSYDFKTVIAFGLIDFPQEFKNHFTEWLPKEINPAPTDKPSFLAEGIYSNGVNPDGSAFLNVENPVLMDLVEVVLKAHIDTYPEADYYEIGPAELRSPVGGYKELWAALDSKYKINQVESLNSILDKVSHRDFYETGRAKRELESDIQFLYFLDKLLNERKALGKTLRPDATLLIDSITEELDPVLPSLLPRETGYVSFIDYTMSRVAKRTEPLASLKGLWTLQIMTLQDDNASMLSQMVGHSMESVIQALNRYGIQGYYVRFWMPNEIELAAYFLSRASWDRNVKADDAYRDLLAPMCSNEVAAKALVAFRKIGEATAWGDFNGMVSAGFPVVDCLMKHFKAREPAPAKLEESRRRYGDALPILLEARDACTGCGHELLSYTAGRLQTTIHYLHTCQKAAQLGEAYKDWDELRTQKRVEATYSKRDEVLGLASQLEEQARTTVASLAAVVRDQSDKGMLAIMNRYVVQYASALHLQLDLELGSWSI